jgi:hypothetical protein
LGCATALAEDPSSTREQRVRQAVERHYRLKELQALTGITTATWRKKILHRLINYTKLGGTVLVSESELKRLLQDGAVPARESR